MINIKNNEEFSAAGRVWKFDDSTGKVVLRNLREASKSRGKEFIPPTIDEVKAFFKEKGYTEESAIKAYNYYAYAEWKDSKGKQVLNWRQKFSSVWFRDEHKIKEQTKEEKKESKFLFGE